MNAIEEQALARYGASADLIALFAGLSEVAPFAFSPELLRLFAIERTAEQAAAHFEDSPMHQILPTPLIPNEFLRIGQYVTGLYTVTNAGQKPNYLAAATRWGIAVPEEPTGAVVFQAPLTPDVEPVVTTLLTFGTGQYDDIARFGTVMDFAVIYPPAWQQVDELVILAGTDRLTDLGLTFILLDDASFENDADTDLELAERFLMSVPTIYQEHARRALEQPRLVVYLFFANGTEVGITIPVTEEARAAFDEALAAWE